MQNEYIPPAWNEFSKNLKYFPVIVKSLEKIHDTSWSMEPNTHDWFEMVCIKKGNAIFTIEEADVPLAANNLVIIQPHKRHQFRVKSTSCEFMVISFSYNHHHDSDGDGFGLDNFITNLQTTGNGDYIALKLGPKNEIVNTMTSILRERDRGEIWSDFLVYLLVMELFVLLSRNIKLEYEQNIKYKSMNLSDSLSVAKQYMDDNYSREITLGDVARYVYLSESYFAHSFKAAFGISPKSYILNARITQAVEVLKHTDMKISDVAIYVGFSSQQRFNDIFKKSMGVTPLKYRKKWKQSITNKIL